MFSQTTRIRCPKCGSDDCNYTVEKLGDAIHASLGKTTEFCNHCTYTKVRITINTKEIFTETKLPDSEDTELEYKFFGREES